MTLPPPRPGDAARSDGKSFVLFGNQWVEAPPVPERYRVDHRVQTDFGSDGVRQWPRWWCSCGAHGQGWSTNHPEES